MFVTLYHHRSRKKFEKWLRKRDITFTFKGYACGYYDPAYLLDAEPSEWDKCPVSVWNKYGNLIHEV